jgi:iron complex outermembrane recepter protein
MGMFMHQKSKKVLNCFVAAWVVWLGGNAVYAADPAPQAYKIEPQSVSTALKAFAAQSNLQLIFTEADVGSATTNGVSGTKAPREALSEILKDTGLKFEFTANNVVVVKKTSREAKSDPPSGRDQTTKEKEGKPQSSTDFRLAQVDQGAAGTSAVEKNNKEKQADTKKTEGLEEIVVTGTRLRLKATEGAQDVKTYSREQIDESGQTSIADFLNTLSDVSVASTESNLTTFGGATTVQLHGLPVGSTLALLNGRRLETSGSQGFSNFFDLNSIPLAAVDRIEVVSEGSSAVYGSDALAGVVNIVLKQDLDGLEIDGGFGRAAPSDEENASLAWGKSWTGGSLSLIGSYQTRSELIGDDRSITANQNYTSFGGSDVRIPSCNPGNVFSIDGSDLPGPKFIFCCSSGRADRYHKRRRFQGDRWKAQSL